MESVKSINPFKSKCLNHGLFGLKDYTEKNFKMVELKYKDITEKTKDSSLNGICEIHKSI